MTGFLQRFSSIFRMAQPAPPEYRRVFRNLYFDIAWFGIVTGTTLAFLGVFATRQGATPAQIGLLSALPALVNLMFALPAGTWLSRRPMGKAVFWSSVFSRAFYVVFVPLPVLLLPEAQVWVILLVTLVMTIPATAMVVGFNSLLGEVVPVSWRGHVAGIRNAILSVVATVFTLISGQILARVDFPTGYQIVFGLGVVGAAMSSYHLFVLASMAERAGHGAAAPASNQRSAAGRRLADEINALYRRGLQSLRLDVLAGRFARIMGLLFFWHLVQFMTIPSVTPFIVNELKISDQMISLANSCFNLTMFAGSLRLSQATVRFGNKNLTAVGILLLSTFPILTAFGVVPYLFGNVIGGVGWALTGGALYNYLLDNVPAHDRPAHLAWYSLVSNAAILIGSLSGPTIAGVIGFSTALLVFGIGRFLAGAALLRWG
jgi:MFS family permease